MAQKRCPECGSENLSYGMDGETCKECGLVIDDTLFEKNPYLPQAKRHEASIPGNSIAGTKEVDGRIVKNLWLMSTREKNLRLAKRRLELMESKLKLPKMVSEEAYAIFKKAVDQEINQGRDNLSMLYASVYASCIMHGFPKTPLELIAYTSVSRTKLLRSFKTLKAGLGMKLEQIDPIDLIPRFGSRLKLQATTITTATEIVVKLKNTTFTAGKHPKTIVASALYIATKINKDYMTQREIANATGVMEVTIRQRSKEIVELIN